MAAAEPPPAGLRVLHVEDNPADAELTRALLEDEWTGCRVVRVDTREAYLQALQEDCFDVILSDSSLPGFDGLSALRIARERLPAAPFIFFSGAIAQERAAEALEHGAIGYAVKDRPAELIAAMHQALGRVDPARRGSEEPPPDSAALLDAAGDAIFATDLLGRIIYWNASAARLSGWAAADAMGRLLDELDLGYDPAQLADARSRVLAAGGWRGDFRLHRRSGDLIEVESTWSLVRGSGDRPRAVLHIDRDVTERRKREIRLLRAEHMESIGMLAGGIAHDFNNVFTPILLGTDLLRMTVGSEKDLHLIANIETSARNGAALVGQLTSFARGGESEPGEIRIAALVGHVRKLLRHGLPPGIALSTVYAEDSWTIAGDAMQLKQVLLNLCLNARDAMPGGGRLELRAGNERVDATLAARHPGANPGAYLHVTVRDTGTGIPASVLPRIFDPYFSTKGAGRGTGLGLSAIAGIVKSHGGFIDVESRVGQGTGVHLYLPALQGKPSPEKPPANLRALAGAGETVLLIDDDATVGRSLRFVLEEAGYRAVTAAGGSAGLAEFTKRRETMAVVIIELIMPGLGGHELIAAVRAERPRQAIIAVSRLPEPEAIDRLRALDPPVEFLAKPTTAEALLSAMRRVLEGTAQRPA